MAFLLDDILLTCIRLALELIERKAVPDTQDLLGDYEILLDDEGNMKGYERKKVRKRTDHGLMKVTASR